MAVKKRNQNAIFAPLLDNRELKFKEGPDTEIMFLGYVLNSNPDVVNKFNGDKAPRQIFQTFFEPS